MGDVLVVFFGRRFQSVMSHAGYCSHVLVFDPLCNKHLELCMEGVSCLLIAYGNGLSLQLIVEVELFLS